MCVQTETSYCGVFFLWRTVGYLDTKAIFKTKVQKSRCMQLLSLQLLYKKVSDEQVPTKLPAFAPD